MSERIKYIDALRGLAMLMVVMVHVEGFSVFIEEFHMSFLRRFCEALMLPLFFFISGFLTKPVSGKKLIEKCTQLLTPACLLGLLYSFYIHKDPVSFIQNIYKYGYWFTVTLSEMLVIINLTTKALRKCNFGSIAILVVAALLYVVKIPFNHIKVLDSIGDIFCFHQLFLYFHYFAIGYVLSNNKQVLNKLLSSELIVLIAIFVFSSSLYVKFTYPDELLAANLLLKIYRAVLDPILGYSGIFVIYKLFYSKCNTVSEGILGKLLQFIGRNTFEIYLLHYFFLPKLPELGIALMHSHNIVIEFICVLCISLTVISCSLIVSKIIKTNSITAFLFLGVKPKFYIK